MARSLSDRKAQEWRRRLVRFEKSRHTINEFCRQEGFSPQSFYLWRKRLARPATKHCGPTAGRFPAGAGACRRAASACNCPAARNWSSPRPMPRACSL